MGGRGTASLGGVFAPGAREGKLAAAVYNFELERAYSSKVQVEQPNSFNTIKSYVTNENGVFQRVSRHLSTPELVSTGERSQAVRETRSIDRIIGDAPRLGKSVTVELRPSTLGLESGSALHPGQVIRSSVFGHGPVARPGPVIRERPQFGQPIEPTIRVRLPAGNKAFFLGKTGRPLRARRRSREAEREQVIFERGRKIRIDRILGQIVYGTVIKD
jgi:hypothetical protein